MSSSGCLVPPNQNPEGEQLWTETWKRIDRFLPDLKNELLLDDPRAETPTPTAPDVPKAEEKVAEAAETGAAS